MSKMKIAILGATSQIASDYIDCLTQNDDASITGFVRLGSLDSAIRKFGKSFDVRTYAEIASSESFDLVLNCVGVGNPARASEMQSSIFKISDEFDDLALELVLKSTAAKYVFLSSGVAYGQPFDSPATVKTIPKNIFDPKNPSDQYGYSKYSIESKHRNLSHIPIYDLRIFGYFNHSQDLNSDFLLTNIARSIKENRTFTTSSESIVRDYVNAEDFYSMMSGIATSPERNIALDMFSLAPVEKFRLLDELSQKFNFDYEVSSREAFTSPTGAKPHYYSTNYEASNFGYRPSRTSLQTAVFEMGLMISKSRN